MANFVLVHGAWHGGWCWERVKVLLEREGHQVLTPTLTGLGDRAHLLNPDVGVHTHVDDVCDVLRDQRAQPCVLVGHSYAGMIIAGVLDRLQQGRANAPGGVRRVVYLDAVMLIKGQCWADTHTLVQREARLASRQNVAGVSVFPPPNPVSLGIADAADAEWVASLLTPQPARTYLDVLDAPRMYENAVPRTYVDCIAPPLPTLAASKQFVRSCGDWDVRTLAAGHDCMLTEPDLTTALLLSLV